MACHYAAEQQRACEASVLRSAPADPPRPTSPAVPDPGIDWRQLEYLRTETDLTQARAHQAAAAAQVAALAVAREAAGRLLGPEGRLARPAALLAARRVWELERPTQYEPTPTQSSPVAEEAGPGTDSMKQ